MTYKSDLEKMKQEQEDLISLTPEQLLIKYKKEMKK
jgi:hypothetical protein